MGYFDNPDQCMCEQGDNNILYKSHTKAAIVLGNWLSVLNSNFSFQIIKELVVSKWWKEGQDEGGGRGQQEGVFLCTIRHPPVASWCHHPHICKSALSFCLSVILSFWQCLIVGECVGSVAFFSFFFVFSAARDSHWGCLIVGECVGGVVSWVRRCTWPTATPLPTHRPAHPRLSLVHTSTNHGSAVLTVTGIMGTQRHAWSGMAWGGEERGVLEGLDLEGSSSCRVVATSPPPNMGARLTGVKIENSERRLRNFCQKKVWGFGESGCKDKGALGSTLIAEAGEC